MLSSEKLSVKVCRSDVVPGNLQEFPFVEHYYRSGRVFEKKAGWRKKMGQALSNEGACKKKDAVHYVLAAP